MRIGGLMPNPLVSTGDGAPVRLDAVLRGRTAVLTSGRPSPELVNLCHRHRLLLVRVSAAPESAVPRQAPAAGQVAGACGVEDKPLGGPGHPGLRAMTGNPGLSVLVRPDRVIADVATSSRLPRPPWNTRTPGYRPSQLPTLPGSISP
jgi:hypothetical protein